MSSETMGTSGDAIKYGLFVTIHGLFVTIQSVVLFGIAFLALHFHPITLTTSPFLELVFNLSIVAIAAIYAFYATALFVMKGLPFLGIGSLFKLFEWRSNP